MSEIIRASSFSGDNLLETTQLDADITAGTDSATILSAQGFPLGAFILLGNAGSENAEILSLSAINDKVFTFSTPIQNAHYRFEPVTRLFGDQVRLYKALNVDNTIPTDASFSYVGAGIIAGDNPDVDVIDPIGGSGYWYKTTYFNSVSLDETDLSMSIAVRSGNAGKLVSIAAVRSEAGFNGNQNIADSAIADHRDYAEDEVLGRLAAAGYVIPLQAANGTLYVPPQVENIARLLAAGYLLKQEYGPVADGDTKQGDNKIKQANDMLTALQKQEMVLLDATKQPLFRSLQVSGWPDSTTQFVGTSGRPEPSQMTMDKRF